MPNVSPTLSSPFLDDVVNATTTARRVTVHDEVESPGYYSEASVVESGQVVRRLRARFAADFFDEEDISESVGQASGEVPELLGTPEPTTTGLSQPTATAPRGTARLRKRKSKARDPTASLLPGQEPLKTIRYNDEMNDTIMRLFSTETKDKGTGYLSHLEGYRFQ